MFEKWVTREREAKTGRRRYGSKRNMQEEEDCGETVQNWRERDGMAGRSQVHGENITIYVEHLLQMSTQH